MATETIWSQASPTGAAGYATTEDNGSYGLYFTVNANTTLVAIWFYSPATSTKLPTNTALYSTTSGSPGTGTLVAQNTTPSWSGAAGSGWVRDNSFPSTAITAGTIYVAQYYATDVKIQGYLFPGSSPAAWFPSSSTSGLINAPSLVGSAHNGPYLNSSNAYPSSNNSNNLNWLADVEVTSLAPAATGAATPPQIPHPLWFGPA